MTNPPLPVNDHADLPNLIRQAQQAYDHADHTLASACYARLIQAYPNHPVIRRNALLSLEYDLAATPAQRLNEAMAWGRWVTGNPAPARPAKRPLDGRPLRVGYVSADICQHTVGFLVKDVLLNHNPDRVTPYVYSAGTQEDWITRKVARATNFRNVTQLDDHALADLIRQDQIDVLIDLSGHTAGSRLSVFGLRPAPVQISWLGYFATTGLSTIDAVLLDRWHHTPEIEASFCERIIDLPSRFCYQPAPFTPEVSPPPVLERGYITFGSFNNTAKLNAEVLRLWAKLLLHCPNTRLILKWRTLDNDEVKTHILQQFIAEGVSPERIELRGASFHADVLKEYADIDIALDPFPFCGGLTTCEALWMGVPVITLPGDRAVSRQSTALLNLIGHSEWIATGQHHYLQIAMALAADNKRLSQICQTLRADMLSSRLMDIVAYVQDFEQILHDLFNNPDPA